MKNDFKLSDLPKRNIYEVPDKYFDRLPAQIMERTAGAGYSPAPWYAAAWKPLKLAMAPLVLLLVAGIVYFSQLRQEKEEPGVVLATVGDEAIMDYLSTYAVLESSDFADMTTLSNPEMTAEFLNVSSTAAEEELEYYRLDTIDY
ncbi:hypothetical protein I0P70_05820 [Pontibacter sp. FD36]|uniref:Uncharacterized protein n=1 Tax=Pontibacter lucknowensis TaxID=1077936 RepID=A0A1N6YK53_9BACT|nr:MULTISPECIES: hypothetical protein [Pontibacter]EJF09145.1 hypothetical protein O71_16781 [Pontibacter sp. BAB1700]MBF8962755.1 hypothetical protein [Pontibacter sp. FD36]SIR14965.1 hypothetical protein SAMN05421545_2545 [Pontibacter lucknowensis]